MFVYSSLTSRRDLDCRENFGVTVMETDTMRLDDFTCGECAEQDTLCKRHHPECTDTNYKSRAEEVGASQEAWTRVKDSGLLKSPITCSRKVGNEVGSELYPLEMATENIADRRRFFQ